MHVLLNPLSLSFWIAFTVDFMDLVVLSVPYAMGVAVSGLAARHIPLLVTSMKVGRIERLPLTFLLWMVCVYLAWHLIIVLEIFLSAPLRRGPLHRWRTWFTEHYIMPEAFRWTYANGEPVPKPHQILRRTMAAFRSSPS